MPGILFKDISFRNECGRANIISFHHCGGNASIFRSLARNLIDFNVFCVILPGRDSSKKQELLESVNEMADEVEKILELRSRDVLGFSSLPTILLGHSLGGILAYETILRLSIKQPRVLNVQHLIVSSVRSPDCLSHMNSQAPENLPEWFVHLRDDDWLLEHCVSMMSTSVDKEFIRAKLHAIRGDFKAFETYSGVCNVLGHRPRVIPCEISCFYGTNDEKVPRLDAINWDNFTCNSFHFTQFQGGGHFYLTDPKHIRDFHARVKLIGERTIAETEVKMHTTKPSSLVSTSQRLFPPESDKTINDAGHLPHCVPLFAPPAVIRQVCEMSTKPPMSPSETDFLESFQAA